MSKAIIFALSFAFSVVAHANTACQIALSEARTFFANQEENAELARDADDGESWPTDGAVAQCDSQMSYNSVFAEALGHKTLETIAREKGAHGRSFHVADFFGSAVFASEPMVFSSLTGVRFARLKRSQLPRQFPAYNWDEVTGDIYTSKLWRRLDANMRQRHIPAFDMIIIRPDGPLKMLLDFYASGSAGQLASVFFQVNGIILQRAWKNLNPNGGEILIGLTTNEKLEGDPTFRNWLARLLNQNIGAQIYEKHGPLSIDYTLKLTRNAGSSNELPL